MCVSSFVELGCSLTRYARVIFLLIDSSLWKVFGVVVGAVDCCRIYAHKLSLGLIRSTTFVTSVKWLQLPSVTWDWFFTRLNQCKPHLPTSKWLATIQLFIFTYNYKRSFLSQASSLTKYNGRNMLSWLGSIPGWSSPGGLKDSAYVLSPFENRFIGLNSSAC